MDLPLTYRGRPPRKAAFSPLKFTLGRIPGRRARGAGGRLPYARTTARAARAATNPEAEACTSPRVTPAPSPTA